MPHSIPVLATKLHPARPQQDTVVRTRLALTSADLLRRRLIVTSAPAGFGKTTLVGSWLEDHALPAAWLSLDKADNEPARFLTYLRAALQRALPEVPSVGTAIEDALRMSPLPEMDALMTALVNELAAVETDLLLVLDDFHMIEAEPVLAAVSFLIEHAPPALHIVLCTRVDPPFPLSRLRVRGQLLELRARELRFTLDETRQLFNEALETNLTERQLERLEERTEGWAAGLQMAAISVRGRTDVDAFLDAFTGTDRYVLDYLVEEVLARQPEDLKRAMLELSVLESFNASLAEAVTGRTDGAGLLAALERANLFVLPLDDRREWFRYHHLFADLLQHHLVRLFGSTVTELHRRAYDWHRLHGDIPAAIAHAHAAGDGDRLGDVIASHWTELITPSDAHDALTLARLEIVPKELVASNPALGLLLAVVAFDAERPAIAERALDDVDAALATGPLTADAHDLRAYSAFYRSRIALAMNDAARAVELGGIALDAIEQRAAIRDSRERTLHRAHVLAFRGMAESRLGDYTAAEASWEEVLTEARRSGNTTLAISMLHNLTLSDLMRARLTRAWARCEEILRLKEDVDARLGAPATFRVDVAHAHQKMASVLFDRNQVTEALAMVRTALELYPPGLTYQVTPSLNLLVLVQEALGDAEGVEEALERFERIPFPPEAAAYAAAARTLRAWVDLRAGRLDAVAAWADAFFGAGADRLPARTFLMSVLETTVRARHLAQTGSPEEGLASIRQLSEGLRARGLVRREIDALVVEALIERGRGMEAEAVTAIGQALRLAAPEKIARPFVAEGPEMRRLLDEWRTERASVEPDVTHFVSRVLRMLEGPAPQRTGAIIAAAGPGEQLTSRELEILRLMSAGYSNQKIASKLYLSVNTIKTHASNLFSKLGARSRIEAIARAREEGVLVE